MNRTGSRYRSRPHRADPLLMAILLATLPALPAVAKDDPASHLDATSAQAPDQVLFLQVTLNQTDTGRLEQFILRQDKLQASVETLRSIGFTLAGHMPSQMIALDELAGVRVRYQADLQLVEFDAPLSELTLETTVLQPQLESAPLSTQSAGALLNYELFASRDTDTTSLTTTTETRAFGLGPGMLSNTSVLRLFQRRNEPGWRAESVRLDSSWRLDLPPQALSIEVGDFYSSSLDWTRSRRMGGIQISRNFGLQPYQVTTPLPTFAGEATAPSSVELYIDGLRQYSGKVDAGPFQLSTMPGITGNGVAQVVVTDAFGQVRTLDFSFYGTQQLLAKGLSEGGLGFGVLRRDYATRSFGYDHTPVFSGSVRYGLSNTLTVEGHTEAGGGLINAGAGGVWQLGRAGMLSAAYAASELGPNRGGKVALDYNLNTRRYNVSIGTQRTHDRYRSLGSLQGNLPTNTNDHAVFGVSSPRYGTFSTSYLHLRSAGLGNSRYASMFWSQSFGSRWSSSLSVNQNLESGQDRSFYFSLALSLDALRQASVSVQRSGRRSNLAADVSKAIPGDGGPNGLGWRVQARAGGDDLGGLAELGWQNDIGRYALGAASQGGSRYAYGSASGSVVWLGRGLLAARDINNSFAVVDTGLADIPVHLENRLIGRTNQRGLLLVTPLQPWQRNYIGIDTMDLASNMRVDTVEQQITPRALTGLLVKFSLAPTRDAIVVLHDPAGRPLPVASQVTVESSPGQPVLVGYDGEIYLYDLQAHNRLRVVTEQGSCSAWFDLTSQDPGLSRIGPLTCTPEPSK